MTMELKRLFFGMEAMAPWPEEFPPGRILGEADRHLTLAFLGNEDADRLLEMLPNFPKPPFATGLAGIFDRPVFLPPRVRRTASWHLDLLEEKESFFHYQKRLAAWLKDAGFALKGKNEFLTHVTIARKPFDEKTWKESFQKRPVFLNSIHLYESSGKYKILWSYPLPAPFDPIEHTADLAFRIRGKDLSQIYLHAQLAMSFYFPQFIRYFDSDPVEDLDQIVASLNAMIAKADRREGCPFKAVSFHGKVKEGEWEMIVDV